MSTSSNVWYFEDGLYVKAEVTQHSVDGDTTRCMVKTAKAKSYNVLREALFPREVLAPGEGVDQLTGLSFLHEAAIIDNLRERFIGHKGNKVVYTYCGQICIAVNPYLWLRELYTENVMSRYMGARLEDNAPHVYAVADAAYMAMRGKGGGGVTNQSILVSGESGAGKTESVKIMMQYLAQLGGKSEVLGKYSDVAEAVIQANPLLEAFGNAKTLLNNNSSRFGKFTKILFDEHGCIAGSRVDTYLLEKSRVVRQAEGERNYHIFYQILASSALPKEFRDGLNLTSASEFKLVSDVAIAGLSDEKEFEDMQKSMTVVGIKEDEQYNIFTMVAAAMNLGQTDFEKGIGDGGDEKAILKPGDGVTITAELLKVSKEGMASALVNRTMEARGESYTLSLTLAQAVDARDALAKGIYHKLFDWLVGRINVSTAPQKQDMVASTIGVLDIFGFESFAYNTLEQLLINFANEKLQQQFTHHVFKLEQEEYDREQIDWTSVDFQDNQPVLDVLEGYGSVLALLQEECQLQKGTDVNLHTKLQTNAKRWPKVKDPETGKPLETLFFNRKAQNTFTVRHYAGPVEYDVIGFVEKNRDTLQPDLIRLMQSSESVFVTTLFKAKKTESKTGRGGSSKAQGLGQQFKNSLGSLIDYIDGTGVHYVRCIKPNLEKSSTVYDDIRVSDQLRCQGILEAIRIARAAYPNRIPHADLTERYQLCLRDAELAKNSGAADDIGAKCNRAEPKVAAQVLLDALCLVEGQFQVGLTKVFFKREALEALEAARARVVEQSLIKLQAAVKRMVHVKRFARMKEASLEMQRIARGRLARRNYEMLLKAIIVQARWRSFTIKRTFQRKRNASVVLQGGWRRKLRANQRAKLRTAANAAVLQALIRRRPQYFEYQKQRTAAFVMQKNARCYNQQRRYVRQRDEKRAKAKLENRLLEAESQREEAANELETLRQQLEAEKAARMEAEKLVASLKAELADAKSGASGNDGGRAEAGVPPEELLKVQESLKQEKLRSHAQEDENKALREELAKAASAPPASGGSAGGVPPEELLKVQESLKQEKLRSHALEDENKALRGQVATVLSYLDQVMPMDQQTA